MKLKVRLLGDKVLYEPTWQAMKDFVEQRTEHTSDEIWLLEHQPVYTQGQAGKPEHVLFPGDIPVVQTDRGGQVTYHGPGQITAYFLLDIKRLGLGPRQLVDAIEQSLVSLLKRYDIEAYPKSDAPGVYVVERGMESKIASLGLRIRKGFSYHGLALNVDMDLEPFQRINPCGYAGMAMSQMTHFNATVRIKQVMDALSDELRSRLGYDSIEIFD
ncbi:lipoyl(octanoyl) transferase LipB [Bermanella marisrubri]|uniref:Octanoyltransferase n=1 Tax=Bermanella marisrubri TaxID=207949 RepID=Q1N086_9GAMM|nr:lipoyl(octanoyl) transferase LipB [Bermanella marisrubri]EAT11631.1 lipoyltransferase [Oceanobacter sp. RED65] [Bermanella marisrubri]QIZ83327.1 lipoyl(octanoyl) transferase LipB [Bermanella marisrubri]